MKNIRELRRLAKLYIDEKLYGNNNIANFQYSFKQLDHELFSVIVLSRVTKLSKRLMDKMIKDADQDDVELMWSCMSHNDNKQDVAKILYKAAYKAIIQQCKNYVIGTGASLKKGYREVA